MDANKTLEGSSIAGTFRKAHYRAYTDRTFEVCGQTALLG